ncbi:choice-of-anchor I family protein [Massilia sp.]|uniref:choice-of-anchor I family protein n=1 Tax=Massilia sp. TaxID=1882437 RepID=UPI0028A1866E|nr:choice-of-anchor I family protein [Massilia sp.]
MPQRFATPSKFLPMLSAIALACLLTACGGDDDEDPTPTTLSMEKIGSFDGGAVGAAEITAYDAASKRLFVVNGANGTVDVLDLATPSAPKRVGTISVSSMGAAVNSVAVHDGLVALAIEASPKTSPGTVAFYNAADLKLVNSVKVGALPDMLVFTPDGSKVLVANEGEPNSYGLPDSIDPEGSISIITVNRGGTPSVATADFKGFNGQEAALRAQGIRIFGPGASAAQDFEPEYITVSDDGRTAWATLQENNAIATIDVASAKITSVKPLGFKNHNVAGMGMDASDEDGGTNTNSGTPLVKIAPQPVKGMYLPDAIASYSVDGVRYLITANEGDARADWPGFNEETRVRAHCTAGLDPSVFPDAANLILDSNLGRLRVTTSPNGANTGKNAAGQCTELYSFGGRSFSIWNTDITRVYDSGDEFEQRTKALPNVKFNASNDNNDLDGRSASKGPEPEGVVVGKFGNKTYAFIGLERVGGVMVYDVTKPTAASFVTYLNTRDGDKGDLGPEGLTLIPANKSPNNKPLLVVGNEVSGTTAIMQINLSFQ